MPGPRILNRSAETLTVACAFCGATGKDPFGSLSEPSPCQVCRGLGRADLAEPAIECAFCKGTGLCRDQPLPCTVCGGKGMVTIQRGSEPCPDCSGKGIAGRDPSPCVTCGGTGVVLRNAAALAANTRNKARSNRSAQSNTKGGPKNRKTPRS